MAANCVSKPPVDTENGADEGSEEPSSVSFSPAPADDHTSGNAEPPPPPEAAAEAEADVLPPLLTGLPTRKVRALRTAAMALGPAPALAAPK